MRQSARTSDRLRQSASAGHIHRCAHSPCLDATRRLLSLTRRKDQARGREQMVRDPLRASPPSALSADWSRESVTPSAAYGAQPTSHSGRRSAHWLRGDCDTAAHTSSPARSPYKSASALRRTRRPLSPWLTPLRWVYSYSPLPVVPLAALRAMSAAATCGL